MQASNFITKQAKILLESKQHAILTAVALSVLPFATWLSVALVALITLRKGAKFGFEVMLPAAMIHTVPLVMLVPLDSAIINTLVAYIPCYVAALSLRRGGAWQYVFGILLIQATIVFLSIQCLAPDFAIDQFMQLKKVFNQYQESQLLLSTALESMSSFVLAQLLFGLQILSVIASTVISLMFARSIQAKLFMPGGFGNEMMDFRSTKLSFLILVGITLASYSELSIALNLLPIVLSYFLLSGLGLAYFILTRKKQMKIMFLLVLLILLKPVLMLFAYTAFGVLDSIFNFRSYLPTGVRESI